MSLILKGDELGVNGFAIKLISEEANVSMCSGNVTFLQEKTRQYPWL